MPQLRQPLGQPDRDPLGAAVPGYGQPRMVHLDDVQSSYAGVAFVGGGADGGSRPVDWTPS